jgi:CRP/FNR family transcriptional regulator, cyclic AMP receptor protein
MVVNGLSDVLALTADMPERTLAAGEVLFEQGERGSIVAVLVEGALAVTFDGAPLDDHTVPGVFVGEIGALLGTERTATVTAREPTRVRIIGDPEAFFASHPSLALELARQLAGRLHRLLAYLGDVRRQYADADGHLTMVDAVLGRLSTRAPVEIEPGSDRSPDY